MNPMKIFAILASFLLVEGYVFQPVMTISPSSSALKARLGSRRHFLSLTPAIFPALVTPAWSVEINATDTGAGGGYYPPGEFNAGQYFGLFSCEGWGLQRAPNSNTCLPREK
uniref:Uncharacterized protein n=1 Tax=Octactis speculum TaxID=3111310 RepID=A0A7S2H296_9STRA